MSDLWYINGSAGHTFSPGNRGLAYGDGLFETMRLVDNGIPLLDRHLSRLEMDSARLGIKLDLDLVKKWVSEAIVQSNAQQALVKLICIRQGPASGYGAKESGADILLRISELNPEASRLSLKAKVCNLRLSDQPALAGIKHLNRLEQILASQELSGDFDEGLLLNMQGHFVEAVSSNLVFVKHSELWFPDLSKGGVTGVMQQYLKQVLPALGLGFTEQSISLQDLQDFDEILLTNSVRGVRNLASIQGYWQSRSNNTGERLRNYLADSLGPGFVSF